MQKLLENWQIYLNEAQQPYEAIISLKTDPDTTVYGAVFDHIRAIPGITIVKSTRSAKKDSAGNKIVTLSLKFLMEPGLAGKYLPYVKDKIKNIKDADGDGILGVRVMKFPERIN
jgi:hypothetical protein